MPVNGTHHGIRPSAARNTVTAQGMKPANPIIATGRYRFIDSRISGGADRDRTGGLLVANQALSQLSYSPLNAISSVLFPVSKIRNQKPETRNPKLFLVGLGRVELPTSPLSGVRSSHLSYRPGLACTKSACTNYPEPEFYHRLQP
jgi:hypothetical protein